MSTSPNKPSLLLWVLLGSVALNGMLGGLLISTKTHKQDFQRRDFSERRVKLDQIVRYLPAEDRHAFLQDFRRDRRRPGSEFKKMRHTERTILELASAKDLDLPTLEAEMTQLRTQRLNLAEQGDKHFLELLTKLDNTTRLTALENLKKSRKERSHSRGHPPRHGGPPGHDRDHHHDKDER